MPPNDCVLMRDLSHDHESWLTFRARRNEGGKWITGCLTLEQGHARPNSRFGNPAEEKPLCDAIFQIYYNQFRRSENSPPELVTVKFSYFRRELIYPAGYCRHVIILLRCITRRLSFCYYVVIPSTNYATVAETHPIALT